MTVRLNIFGFDVAKIVVDIDLGDNGAVEPAVATVMDKVSDYFTRRFVRRRLL